MTAPVGAIRDALTYLARFRGSLFVIKVDDRVLESPMAAVLVHDIVLMQRMGIHAVVVAGARAAIDRALERASLPSRYHRGLRVTTEPMMEHVIHAVSALSTRLMSLFSECGAHAASGNWVRARSLGVVDGVDYDRSGRVEPGRRRADSRADRSRGGADRHHHRLERGRHRLQPGQRRPGRGRRHRHARGQAVRRQRRRPASWLPAGRIGRKAASRCATPARSPP